MKVLMIARKTLISSPGGDTVQINSTAHYLRKLGVHVDVKLSYEQITYSDYDLIHFFNIIRPDDILPHISACNLPFFVSTIFVDYSKYEKKNRNGILNLLVKTFTGDQLEYLKTIARLVKNGDKINSLYYIKNGHKKSVQYIANRAFMLLPNSHSEFNRFVLAYGISPRYHKIPNAIDKEIFSDSIIPNEMFKDHVLCVGRIEGRKNQLSLIKALSNTKVRLTLIGKPSPNHMGYYEECKKLVENSSNIKIIEHVDHNELAGIYKAAKVHILPSWFETTGLSSLEAAIMDCNIVVTSKGDTKEYFGNHAFYCDPESIESIRQAVFEALESSSHPRLKEEIFKLYTWERAAEETLKAYSMIYS